MVIKDEKHPEKRRMTYTKFADASFTKENYDTIKLLPQTLARLKHYYFSKRQKIDAPDTNTFDELVNYILDKLEPKGRYYKYALDNDLNVTLVATRAFSELLNKDKYQRGRVLDALKKK